MLFIFVLSFSPQLLAPKGGENILYCSSQCILQEYIIFNEIII